MKCRFYYEGKYKFQRSYNIVAICRADNHEPDCGGYMETCDKELSLCSSAVWQGPEVFCKCVGETRECRADNDFCELTSKELREGESNEKV